MTTYKFCRRAVDSSSNVHYERMLGVHKCAVMVQRRGLFHTSILIYIFCNNNSSCIRYVTYAALSCVCLFSGLNRFVV
jgi:hypothetical protein